MNFFLVFQRNPYYKHEKKGGYLWAPKENERGQTFFFWKNMTKIRKGDIIFSSHQRKIVSINIVTCDCFEAERPKEFDEWGDMGWMAYVEYNNLTPPINVNDHIDNIMNMLPAKYSPYNVNGSGAQGYLFEIPPEIANYFLYLAQKEELLSDRYIISNGQENSENRTIEEVEGLLNKTSIKTEKEQIIKGRVGQGLFKSKLFSLNDSCVICGLSKRDLLIGSHVKPWKFSAKEERLDVNNGLLMCPIHDALFDKGYIAFEDNGKIVISKELDNTERNLMRIDEDIAISIRPEQINYLKWHRENVFKENIS